MTYSIVARDPVTGELGVAVQTRWFSVGSSVPWAEPGVGAVATQSFTEQSYGPLGLARMREGGSATQALEALPANDPGREVRQVGMVDASGRSAAFTGAQCVAAAGQLTADDLSIQANMTERPTVWPAMAEAYRSTEGDLAGRLMAALRAAEAEGGDVRGRQSAALLVVPASGPAWATRYDLRVDDHRAPSTSSLVSFAWRAPTKRSIGHRSGRPPAIWRRPPRRWKRPTHSRRTTTRSPCSWRLRSPALDGSTRHVACLARLAAPSRAASSTCAGSSLPDISRPRSGR